MLRRFLKLHDNRPQNMKPRISRPPRDHVFQLAQGGIVLLFGDQFLNLGQLLLETTRVVHSPLFYIPARRLQSSLITAECDILNRAEGHAMPFYFFVWTPEIEEHLAEHDVSPEEFEEVVSDPEYEDISRSSGNP